jgi:hypothetical protein
MKIINILIKMSLMNNNLKTLMRIIKCNQKDKKELNKILISSKLKINFLKKLIH